jgi:hypothetical protein
MSQNVNTTHNPHLPTKSPNSQRQEDETEKQASAIEPSPNLNPIAIAKPGKQE